MIKKFKIPTIIGIIVLILGTFTGVLFLGNSQVFKTGADADVAAKNLRVSNTADTTATLTWTTDKETQGFIVWGTAKNNITRTENEDSNNQKYLNHSVTVAGLAPNTTYFYKINSEGELFDNDGIPWQFTTGPALDASKDSVLLSGTVISASGIPEKRALIYADISGYLFSTLTSDTGNYVFQIGSTRTSDLKSYTKIDPGQTLIQISVSALPDGISSAQIFAQSANPVPPIIIGQTYDFRNNSTNSQGVNPNASLNLPTDTIKESKFNVVVPGETPKPTSVILESLVEGETVTTDKPQFFGKGPEGSTLTITVHSENPITDSVQVPKNGSWSYAVPTNLEPGNHTVTISWIDVSGITRFLERNFVVKAGEAPAFSASESSATTAPNATGTPKSFATITPSPTATGTAMPVPVTGDFAPTLLFSIMGLAVTVFSFMLWKVSEN